MKLRLENGNFKVVGIATQSGQDYKVRFNKLPVGLDPIDFLGVIAEIREEVPDLSVTYSEIGEVSRPVAGGDGTVYDDVFAIILPGSAARIPLFYNKTTGDIGFDLEEIANKSESNDTETEQNPGDQGNDGR